MPVLEKRKVERSGDILIVNFRQVNKSRQYSFGIANNYSHKGINFEAACIEARPGEVLEIILKNPYSEWSMDAIGEMVWKVDGWYKCSTGIILKDVDQDAINKMKALMINTSRVHDRPPLHHNEQEQSMEADKEDIAVIDEGPDEITTDTDIISPGDHTLSIPDKEIASPAVEKTEINQYRFRKDKIVFIVIVIVIIFLLVASALFALRTPKLTTGKDAKIKLPVQAQVSTAVRQSPLQKGEIKFDSNSDIISPAFYPGIDKLAKALLQDPGAILRVEGYSDSIGPEVYNLDLAMRRALKVKKLLMKKGINDGKIKITVYGESYPLSPQIDEFTSAVDRRVDMVIVPSQAY